MLNIALVNAPALLWGAFDPDDWQDSVRTSTYDTLGVAVGKPLSLTHGQCAWVKGHATDGTLVYRPFPRARLQADRDAGRLTQLTWLSHNLSNQADISINLHTIVQGQQDAYIAQFATDAKMWGHQFILRFNHEPNGFWFAGCSEQDSQGHPANGNQLGDYVKAWSHIRSIFRSVGCTNATWLWCVNPVDTKLSASPLSPDHLANFRPPLEDFDLAGMDPYNWGDSKGGKWASYDDVTAPTRAVLRSLCPGKRLFYGEMGCHVTPGDKAAWIGDALGRMAADPMLAGFAWFEWALPPTNWLITSSPDVIAAFATGISSPSYLTGGGFPFGDDLTPLPSYALAQVPGLDAQLAAIATQLQSATDDATATQAALDKATAALAVTTTALDLAESASAVLTSAMDQYRQNAQQVTAGLDALRGLSSGISS